MDYLSRYEQLLEQQQIKFLRIGNLLLREYGSIIIPMGPVLQAAPEVKVIESEIFSNLKGKLVWWSYQKAGYEANDWYAVIKDSFIPIEAYRTANIRNQIRKGLRHCEIREIKPEDLLKDGYAIYAMAFASFNKNCPLTDKAYANWIKSFVAFTDIVNFIGIYVDTKLIGYSLIYRYGTQEANISEIRINPVYQKFYPSYALFHWLSEKYLENEHFAYLSDGYRNLVHQTNIQDLLITKFGFKKVGLYLNLRIKSPYQVLFYGALQKLWELVPSTSIRGVIQLLKIVEKQKKRLPK